MSLSPSAAARFCPPPTATPYRRRLSKVPMRARSRSDNYAAVLRLQSTQPKNRRVYTPLTGSSAWTEPAAEGKEPQAGNEGPKDGEGLNRYKGNSSTEKIRLNAKVNSSDK